MQCIQLWVGEGAGVVPLLGAPMFGGSSETLLQQAIDAAASRGLVKPHQSVVRDLLWQRHTCA